MEWRDWLNSQSDQQLRDRFGGLKPRAAIVVGQGFVREELKADLIARLSAFSSEVFLSPQDLVLRAAGASGAQMLPPQSREELLRDLLSAREILARLPWVARMRRRTGGYTLLDRALQQGRLAFVYDEECEALQARTGDARVKREFRALAGAFEAVLQSKGLWDYPLALRVAIESPGHGVPSELWVVQRGYLSRARSWGRVSGAFISGVLTFRIRSTSAFARSMRRVLAHFG